MGLNIDELLNKRLVGNITYGTLLKQSLRDKYDEELPKIKKMKSDEFITYFEQALERREQDEQ